MPPKDAKAAKGKDAKAAKGAKGGAAPPPSDKPKGPKLPVPLDGPPLEPVKVIPPPYDPRVHAPPVYFGSFWDYPGARGDWATAPC